MENALVEEAKKLSEADGAGVVQLLNRADKEMKQVLSWVFGESNDFDKMPEYVCIQLNDTHPALAIAEMIASMSKPTVSIVLGGSHSIGVPLAVAARRSFAVPSAAMTIHPVRMSGTVIAAPQTYSYFQRLQDRIVAFVSGHSAISARRFEELMLKKADMAADVGSVLYGEEAVREGIIDAVGGLSDGLACLYRQIEQRREQKAEP